MEEADTLGDHIAIMDHGKIQCYGSSLFLKNLYSVGYTFTVSVDDADDKKRLDQYVLRNIEGSKMESYINNEVNYRLPFEERFAPFAVTNWW